ncbi:MAG TPA: DMT family transporter [Thermomicrobiales bacterium]|nr:DMT family transporter [Thermomicrobiales bacterium]
MSAVALGLVVFSALLHASWNALTKRSGDGLVFIWSFLLASLVVYAIPFAVLINRHPPGATGLLFALISGAIHVAYFSLLALSYRRADLSFAYPVARGTGVLLSPILAVPIFGDRPTVVAWIGIAAILGGIVWINAPILSHSVRKLGLHRVLAGPPLLTGFTIASYSLVDAGGSRRVQPVVYLYLIFVVVVVAMLPYMLTRRWDTVKASAKHPRTAIIAGTASFSTYLIVLTALRIAPVSYVVPVREVSIVFAALIGMRALGESLNRSRLAACGLVTLGVMLIGVGG